jgi:hypothetical protein
LALTLALIDETKMKMKMKNTKVEKSNLNFEDNFQVVVNIKLLDDSLMTLMVDIDEN